MGGWKVTVKMKPVSAPDYFILLHIENSGKQTLVN